MKRTTYAKASAKMGIYCLIEMAIELPHLAIWGMSIVWSGIKELTIDDYHEYKWSIVDLNKIDRRAYKRHCYTIISEPLCAYHNFKACIDNLRGQKKPPLYKSSLFSKLRNRQYQAFLFSDD